MTRLNATEVARNGAPVVKMRPVKAGPLLSAAMWRELMACAPSPDEDFAQDVEETRKEIGSSRRLRSL